LAKRVMEVGIPTEVEPGCEVEGYGPPWFMAGLTVTPVGILSFQEAADFFAEQGAMVL